MTYKRGRSIIFQIIIFIITVLCCVASVYLGMQLREKVNEINLSKEELVKLQEENDNLQKQITELEQKNKNAQEDIEKLQKQIDALIAHNTELQNLLNQQERKVAYLTFDDGPSQNTIKILDFLKANNIKATFFVIYHKNSDEIYKRIAEEGHTLAVHSMTHDYGKIYKNTDAFMKDIEDLTNYLIKVTGVKPNILRFPGGSNNTISYKYGGRDIMSKIIPKVEEAGYAYFDWNVDSKDASKNVQDKKVIVQSVLEGAKNKNHAIILMHDAPPKTTTVQALPEIVEGLRAQGFVFEKITPETPAVHFQ